MAGQISDTEYKNLVESINVIVWECQSDDLTFTYVSDYAETLLGYSSNKWIENNTFWPSIIHPEDRDWVIEHCRDQTEKLLDHVIEYRIINSDGNIIWLKDGVTVVVNESPRILRGYMADITLLKEYEEQLELHQCNLENLIEQRTEELLESKEMYRTLSRISPVGIIRINEKNKCSYVNKTWQEFSGMSMEDALDEGWKKSIHPEDRYRVVREWNKCARANEDFSFEYRIQHKDGDIVWVLAQANLVNSGGKGYVGTLTDITCNKEILPQVLEIKSEAKCRSKGMIYGVAIRT